MRTASVLILGLGNSVLRDDAVGIKVVESLAAEAAEEGIDTACAEVAGFALIDLLSGYDAAVVVDAIRFDGHEPGDIVIMDASAKTPTLHLVAAHQIDLPNALALGLELGVPMPARVQIVGVQIVDDRTFDEHCTAEVEAAIPAARAAALNLALRLSANETAI